ncbi:MAG: dihydroorotate dehydrogenase electron transfer subunit [Tannerella sp.]|jgi:dihydroorotate dehydrogenase electron transfer subunit|nr:dihydroorotate dehydrogenase electron transfer subunit [Tannerella sp.]
MKKYLLDLTVKENMRLRRDCNLLKLTAAMALPEMQPGQFVEVRVDGSPGTFLRRPISIHYVDRELNELWLLIRQVGEGTRWMAKAVAGDTVNVLLPLGKGFTIPLRSRRTKLLLVGGGVGVAPLLYLGDRLRQTGFAPVFLLGARTREDLLQLDAFRKRGSVHVATEDGSQGEKGLVTDHSLLRNRRFNWLYCCGPKPMMAALDRYAQQTGSLCEVSLENTMACGIGACLCCVERTRTGHACVCTEGPVFPAGRMEWTR